MIQLYQKWLKCYKHIKYNDANDKIYHKLGKSYNYDNFVPLYHINMVIIIFQL